MKNRKERTVTVIGAGIVGMSTALWLQEKGFSVSVIERHEPGMGTSYGNAGTIAIYGNAPIAMPGIVRRIPQLLFDKRSPFALRWSYLPSLFPWLIRFLWSSRRKRVKQISEHLASLTKQADAAYRPLYRISGSEDLLCNQGCVYLYGSKRVFDNARLDIDIRRRSGVDIRILQAGDIHDLEPNLAPEYYKGLLFEGSYHIYNPHELVSRFANAFVDRGGTIHKSEAKDIVRKEQHNLEVITDKQNHSAHSVVVCAGAWSKPLVKRLGDSVLLDTERGYHVMFPKDTDILSRAVCWPEGGFYLTPMSHGLRVAGTVEMGGLSPVPNPERIEYLEKYARKLLPGLKKRGSDWLGFRPSMPESMPVISRSPRDKDVYYAFGHGHIGLTLGGITGKLISELINDQPLTVDISPFSL